MTADRGYASPAAFRRALTDRLRVLAKEGKWTLTQLQRQMAYDRLLERLYQFDDGWIVKGATALLARDLGMRATIDVDVYRAQATKMAEADLRAAASRDIGDWFRFEIGPARAMGEGQSGVRLPVAAYVGAAPWAQFHVDLVGADLRMTGEPEPVPPLARIVMPDIEQHGYRAYPLPDHLADKVVRDVPAIRAAAAAVDALQGPDRSGRHHLRSEPQRPSSAAGAYLRSKSPPRAAATLVRRPRPNSLGTRVLGTGKALTASGRAHPR